MIIPYINIEVLAAEAFEHEPPGLDRETFLLGFVAGAQALNRL